MRTPRPEILLAQLALLMESVRFAHWARTSLEPIDVAIVVAACLVLLRMRVVTRRRRD